MAWIASKPQTAKRYHPLLVSVGLLALLHQRQWQELRNARLSSRLIHTTEEGDYSSGKDLYKLSLGDLAALIADAREPLNSAGLEPQSIVQQDTIPSCYHHIRTVLSQSDNYRHSAMGKSIAESITADNQATGTPCATSLPQ